ncbi:MAG: mechanosensitive ion channel family protein [Thermoplasmata archaeon]|nr:mechanosensitive ion channel family protein [Thermoplasmata archaeon]
MKTRLLTSIMLVTAVLSMLALSMMTGNVQAAEGDINISPMDEYSKSVDVENSVTYRWGLYNSNNTDHMVFLSDPSEEYGWTAEYSETYFMLQPGEFHTVELTVTSPSSWDYPDHSIQVTAQVTDLSTQAIWTKELGSTTTTISGGTYIPPTKAFNVIDNYFAAFEPLDNEYGVFLLTVLIWTAVGLAIFFLLDPIVKYFTKKTETEIDDQILAIVKGPVFYLIAAYGLVSSLEVLNLSWTVVSTIERIYGLLLIVLVSWMSFKIFQDVLLIWGKKYAEESETTMDDVALPLFEKVGMIVIFMIAIIAALNLFGIDPTMLVAGMGIMGLVIAFAAQDTLGNFISGMFLLTDRPFKVGDLVLMENGDYCRVEKIGMRSTKLYNTFDHDVIILPNSKIANEKVINLTEPDNKMKVKVTIGVDYNTDIQKAKQIMLDVANKHTDVINTEDRDPFVRLVDFGDSSINLKLYTWVYHLDDQWRVGGEIREEIFELFKKEGIDIPFPQRVVHMQGYGDNMPSKSG